MKMEGEDSVRTVDCLRGRLLAERAASKNAKEEAQLLENKLIELEKLLKQEAKSRKRAEKKLNFLMKKLESINISSHTSSNESKHSELMDKLSISSISSTPSSITKEQNQEQEESNQDNRMRISEGFGAQESKGQATSRNLEQIGSQNSSFSLTSDCTSTPKGSSVSSAFEALLPEFEGLESPRKLKILEQRNPTFEDSLSEKSSSNMDQQSDLCCLSIRSSIDEEEEEAHDSKNQVDNSMALVLFHMPQKSTRLDPNALGHDRDHTVREVLNSLKRAKDELRSSMQRQRMNMMMRVGQANVTVKTSYDFHIG